MQTYEILVRNRSVVANSEDMTMVRTSIGVDQIHVLFDNAEWLDFPITVTFGQGSDLVTQSLVVSAVTDSDEWVAEATVTVPWEVIDENGPVRVTFQGTDSNGRHIITARGTPLSVEEAGDVEDGSAPSDAPTISQWEQAYANAMQAANDAASLIATLRDSLSDMTDAATAEIAELIEQSYQPATKESLGVVQIGDGIDVDNGVISVSADESQGMTQAQAAILAKLRALMESMVDATFVDGDLAGTPKVKAESVGIATPINLGLVMPDGTSILVDSDGMIHATGDMGIPTATTSSVGAVKPDGTTITVDQDGTIHGSDTVPIATTSIPGKVMPDGTTITVDADGTIHGADTVPIATTSVPGKVMPDGETITVDQDGTIHGAEQTVTGRVGYIGRSEYDSRLAYIIGDESDGTYYFPFETSVASSAFWLGSIRSVDFPKCIDVGYQAFFRCESLAEASFQRCMNVGSSAFWGCTALSKVSFPWLSTIGSSAFYGCKALSEISLPSCRSIQGAAFFNCVTLASLDLTGVSYVASLRDSTAFYSTPIAGYLSYASTYGSIYVRSSLVTAYRSATNWSYYSSRIFGR